MNTASDKTPLKATYSRMKDIQESLERLQAEAQRGDQILEPKDTYQHWRCCYILLKKRKRYSNVKIFKELKS